MGRTPTIEEMSGEPIAGTLWYVAEDYAFDFRPEKATEMAQLVGRSGTASLLFGTVQVELAVDGGRCLCAWGYSPFHGWIAGTISEFPAPIEGACRLLGESPDSGSSLRVSSVSDTKVVYDAASGEVAVLSASLGAVGWAVRIADGVVVLASEAGAPVGLILTPVKPLQLT